MDNRTPTPAEKLAEAVLKAMAEFLKSAGFVKHGGKWVSADDLKADAR